MKKEKLLQIFFEEAEEILEHFDAKVLSLEEDPSAAGIIDDLFRGVHTLKGSAGAFGFTNLESLVHHLEDVIGDVQHGRRQVDDTFIEILNGAVSIIQATIDHDKEEKEGVPEGYNDFMEMLGIETPGDKNSEKIVNETTKPKDESKSYRITLTPEPDIYMRGIDPLMYFRMLSENSNIKNIYWESSAIPDLQTIDPLKSYFGPIVVELATNMPQEELESMFQFLEEGEFSLQSAQEGVNEAVSQQPIVMESEPVAEASPAVQTLSKQDGKVTERSYSSRQEQLESNVQQRTMKIDAQKLDEMFESIGELVIIKNFLLESPELKGLNSNQVHMLLQRLSNTVKEVHFHAMKLRMVPLQESFEKMKRVVRDAAKKSGKRIRFSTYGEETEIDKGMADRIAEPLTHLLRNAIDHGIEATEAERISHQKSPEGGIVLGAYYKADSMVIEVRDDGQGISTKNVLNKAIAKGLVAPNEALSEKEIYALLMHPGFSTRDEVSELSGRGVGLDVVKSVIQSLKGNLEIRSEVGKGTTFVVTLPLSLSIIDGMVLRSGKDYFVLPILYVRESLDYNDNHILRMNEKEYVQIHHGMVRIKDIVEIFDLEHEGYSGEPMLICYENDRGKTALKVDEVIGRQQVVVKSIGNAFEQHCEIIGSTVLGNGHIAFIIDVERL